MGAFFLYRSNTDISLERILDLYQKKGFNQPHHFDLGSYQLLLYQKQLVDYSNYCFDENIELFACGSFFYKGLNYQESLKSLLVDFSGNKINNNRLFGNYVLIFFNKIKKSIQLFIDPSFIKTIYFDKDNEIISTDFLAIATARNNNFNLNIFAIVENIVTGNLIPPHSYIDEIERVDKVNYQKLNDAFPTVKVDVFWPLLNDKINSRHDAVLHANKMLDNYFADAAAISNQFGAHIGLTGGFDSRLLLMHARKNISNLITNSFWRPNSKDYENAKLLANTADIPFYSFEDKFFAVPAKQSIQDESFYVFDGQVRSQNRWDQIFSLRSYTKDIANNHLVGFHGCGGEQYRNADRLKGSVDVESYIYYEWMFKQSADPFTSKNLKGEIYQYIKNKLFTLCEISKSHLQLDDIKKIQNEIWNLSNRATRVNLLNQQQFYFAPFTEYLIAHNAYKYNRYLGTSVDFQTDMIRDYDKQLAGVITNYGYNLIDGESTIKKFVYKIASIFPRKLILQIYSRSKSFNDVQYDDDQYLKTMHPTMVELSAKIDVADILRNTNLASGIISFNHLLNKII